MPFGADQTGAGENTEMRRHGVLRDVELAGYFARSHAVRLVPYQETKDIQACPLGQGT